MLVPCPELYDPTSLKLPQDFGKCACDEPAIALALPCSPRRETNPLFFILQEFALPFCVYLCNHAHVAPSSRFHLGKLPFAWDSARAEANVRTHGITFEEAATTWLDPVTIERFDEEHSDTEDRRLRIGSSLRGALLVVWSTERESGGQTVIRIIGARRTNRRESELYAQQHKAR